MAQIKTSIDIEAQPRQIKTGLSANFKNKSIEWSDGGTRQS